MPTKTPKPIDPPKKRGRPKLYRPSLCDDLLDLMAKGALDCEIYAAWDIHKDTFYTWLNEYPDLREAHNKGLAKCESWWLDWGKKGMRGEIKSFNFNAWIAFMNNKFKWAKNALAESSQVTTNNISIGNMNVLQHKSSSELIEHIKTLSLKHQDILDVTIVEQVAVKNDNGNSNSNLSSIPGQ